MEISINSIVGKLRVLSNPYIFRNAKGKTYSVVDVECECGTIKFVECCNLIKGRTNSCGCSRKGKALSHGMTYTRQYKIWADMKKRCTSEKHVHYENYGGRGISYQESWESFESFWEDMAESYTDESQIDRIDVNGNYCKENCRWTSASVNAHNRRKRKGSACESIGVYPHGNSFRASLFKDGKVILSKTFRTEEEAATAYDNCSEEIYGDRPNKTIVDKFP